MQNGEHCINHYRNFSANKMSAGSYFQNQFISVFVVWADKVPCIRQCFSTHQPAANPQSIVHTYH